MPKKIKDATTMQKGITLFILLLRSHRAWSLTELADKLDCSKQTILRLVDQLSVSGLAPIVIERQGNRNFYKMDKPLRPSPIVLNAEKLAQLILCRDFLTKFLPENVRREVDEALLTVENYLPAEASAPTWSLGRSLSKGWIDYSPFQDFLKTFTKAIEAKTACLVTYQKRLDEEPKKFLYAPKGLMLYQETMYITGWKVLEERPLKAERNATLALQRVRAVERKNNTTINIKESDNLEDGTFGVMLHDPFKAKVKFTSDMATYVSERQWSVDQTIKFHKNGELTLTMTSRNELELVSWVLSFGPAAKIMAPPWLREKMAEKTRNMAAQYTKRNVRPRLQRA